MEFIKYDKINMEFKLFKSEVDYEYLFNNLDVNIKEDLYFLTDFYYLRLMEEMEKLVTLNILIPNIKCIDGMPVKIYLFVVKDYKIIFDNIENVNKYTNIKLGANICLDIKDCCTMDSLDTMQTLTLTNCDTTNEDIFKNYIYNLLFYIHIIMNYFSYNPLLKYIYHEEDIERFIEIKSAHIRLFGEFEMCTVCMEYTTNTTKCKHMLCQKCACRLEKKICPMCRKPIALNEEDIDIHYYIS